MKSAGPAHLAWRTPATAGIDRIPDRRGYYQLL